MGILSLFKKDPNDTDGIDEESLIGEIDKKVKASESTMQAFHRQWFVNIAMRKGLQYVQTDSTSRAVVLPPETDERVRMIVNKMQGIHQTRLAKIVKDLPRLEVIPASSSEEDKDLARNGTKMLDWFWANERMVEKLVELGSWMIDCGSAFFFVRWDPDKGPEIPKYKRHEGKLTGKEPYIVDVDGYILDENGKRIVEYETLGEVAIDVVSSFDIINDQVSATIEGSNWIIVQQAMSLGQIRKRWPETGKAVKAEKDSQTRAYYQRRLMSMVGSQSEFFTPETAYNEELATVKFYFEKSTDEYPKGRYLAVANGKMLESGTMPFGDGTEYPLLKFDDIAVSGSFWGNATMENIIPIQKGYNRTLSQILENANDTGNVKIMAPKGHGLHKEAYDDSAGEFIEYNEGFKPEQLDPASMPAYIVNLLEVYDKNFEDVSGQHEVSHGQAPAGVKSGRAIMALQEQDDTRLAPTKMRFLRQLERLGIMVLKLYEEFQNEDRQYQILGESVYDIEEITISEDDIQSMNKNVRVQTENLIAAHKMLQQEQVIDLYNAGVFGAQDDPKVRKKVLQLMEFGSIGELFDDMNVDQSQARHENEQFVDGQGLIPISDPDIVDPQTGQPVTLMSIQAYDFEDHQIHIETHNKLRKSPRYRQMTPAQRRAIDIHVMQHQNFLNPQPKAVPPPPGPPSASPPPPGMLPRRPGGSPLPMPKSPMPALPTKQGPAVTAGAVQPPPAAGPAISGPDLGAA